MGRGEKMKPQNKRLGRELRPEWERHGFGSEKAYRESKYSPFEAALVLIVIGVIGLAIAIELIRSL